MDIRDIKHICKLIEEHNNFLILTHKNPDGDALGSTVAMAELLEKSGKCARILYPEAVPKRLEFILCGRAYMTPAGIDKAYVPDFIISLDCAAKSRLGALEEEYASRVDLSIDHHVANTPFAKETYTDPHASAASELVYEIAKELEADTTMDFIDSNIAFPLYAGIASDTGSFKYSNTTERTFLICAKLISTGINTAEISRLLFDTYPIAKIKAEAIGANRLKLHADGKVALISIPEEILGSEALTYDDFDDAVNIARRTLGVEVGIYIRNSNMKNTYKISLRSNVYVNVSDICAKHGGGGHIRAAGCTVNADSIEEAADIILSDVIASL